MIAFIRRFVTGNDCDVVRRIITAICPLLAGYQNMASIQKDRYAEFFLLRGKQLVKMQKHFTGELLDIMASVARFLIDW